MMNKVVSIITPSFNRANIIQETADSIFNQTYPHWEWVIVDDGSTDKSWGMLEQYAARDSRVKIFRRNREPKGAAACRNIAVEKSTGDYVIFLDTDDLLASFCLKQRVKAAEENSDCDFIVFPMLLFKKRPDDLSILWNVEKEEDEINRLLFGDPICQGTGTIWKKKSFVKIGMWDENLMLWQDIELHLRSILAGLNFKKRMDLLPDIFLRISDESLSRTGFHSLSKLQSRIKVFTNSAEIIFKLHKTNSYRNGLRHMGSNLILNAFNSSYFTEGKNLLQFCVDKNIISKSDAKTFSKYLQYRKLKLYRLPFIKKKISNRVNSLIPQSQNTLGKIKYTHPIIF